MIVGTKEKTIKVLQKRAVAYNKVFDKKSPFTEDVLRDLSAFCKFFESTFHADARISAHLDGRREVFMRIMENLQFSYDDIFKLHKVYELEK